ncbi:hypothetical protein A2436_01115 [candidate division WS6 bacterium RIFOXYC1_FULL_33_9]|nr:MAG: hypothetical protein A2436_01115 [candidate division WS6 bacterium RIFOXYC1_FULL_33_9]
MSTEDFTQDRLIEVEKLLEIELPNTSKKEKRDSVEGARVSPSQIEKLSYLYELHNRIPNDIDFVHELTKIEPIEKEKALESARYSIYGTQMHQLQYFTQLFNRTEQLNRLPSKNDFLYTFPFRNSEYYKGLQHILDITDTHSNNISQSYWNEWRMNGQDFTPKRHKNYIINPSTIRDMWELGVIPLEDMDTFNMNKEKIDKEKLNPHNTMLLNETFSILNIFFNDCHLQVPTLIDEICIPNDFPNSPIRIIDYKTGSQFKEPEYKERIQMFLMMTSILVNMMDRVGSVQFKQSQWDITHNTHDLPFFTKRKLKDNLIGSVYFDQILDISDVFNKYFKFSYVNPLTQESIDININDIGIDIKDMLMYLNGITSFYIKYRNILKPKIDSNRSPYTLPSFPIKDFDKCNGFSNDIQLGLNF